MGTSGRMSSLHKISIRPCCIPDCDTEVRPSNTFPICAEHMLRIWKLVSGEPSLGRDLLNQRSEAWNVPTTLTVEEQEIRRLAARAKQRELATTMGTLYALDTRDGLVKLGYTKRDLWQRLAEYPPTFRLIVSVPGTKADERDVHRSLRMFRAGVTGNEWYELAGEVIRQINLWISQANIITQQAASDLSVRGSFRAKMLPRFESLEQWNSAADPVSP